MARLTSDEKWALAGVALARVVTQTVRDTFDRRRKSTALEEERNRRNFVRYASRKWKAICSRRRRP
jgi:hypothetical protein